MTPRLVSSVLAAALSIGACSSSDDTATTSTSVSSAPDARPGTTTTTTTTTGGPAATATSVSVASTAPPPRSTAPPTTGEPTTTSDVPPVTELTDADLTDADLTDADLTDAEANDRDTARSALITLSVFPDGWVEEPVGDDDAGPDTGEFEAEFDACLGRDDEVRVGDDLDRLKVRTGDFHPVDDDATTVSHEVVLAPDVETALAAMAEVRIDGAESCLADVIGDFYRTAFASDPALEHVDIGDVIVTRTADERDPDVSVGVSLEVPLTIGGQTVSQYLELLYQRQGRALSELSFSSFGTRFGRDGHTLLRDEVITRLAAIAD